MKKAIYVFSILLVALSIGTNYAKGQYSFNFDRVNLDSYVSEMADSWYYNKATQKCVKGNPGTVGIKTYTTEQKCKDANKSNVPIVSIPDKDDPKSWVPIFYTPPAKPEPKVTTSTAFSTPQWSQPQGAPSGLQGLSFFPTATTTDKKPALDISFNNDGVGTRNIFGVTPRENMFLDNKKPDQPAKTGLFSFILDSLTFNKGSNLQVQPTIEPLSEGQPATGYQFATTTGIFGDDVLTYKQPQNKGIIAKLLEGLGIGRGVDAPVATITPSGANIPGDNSPLIDTSKIDSVIDGDVTIMSDGGTGEPGECGDKNQERRDIIEQAIKDNDIKKIEKCVKELKVSATYFEIKGSISEEIARVLANGAIRQLHLDSLTSITKEVAEALASGSIEGLSLDSLTSITKEVAKALASGSIEGLSLNGLTSISKEVAEALTSRILWSLSLNGLTSISKEVAEALTSSSRILSLNGLTSIDPKTATIFAEFEARGGRVYEVQTQVRQAINAARNERAAKSACTITAVSLIQKDKDNKNDEEITKTGNNFLIELEKDLKIKITIACEADNPIVKGSRLQAYFGSAIKDGKTITFNADTKEFTQEFTFTPDNLQEQKNIIERPGVLNVKFYDFATKEESSQIRPLGILFNEKTEQELKLCYKIGSEEKCLVGKNSAFGHIKANKDKSIVFDWEAKNFDLCWLANPKDVRVELTGSRTMASRQSDFENFGITCKYTTMPPNRKEIHQSLIFQIESESKTDDKFDFSIKGNKEIACKGQAEFSWDIGKSWTKCEKIEPTDKTYFDSKDWNIKAGEKGSVTVNLKENKTDKTQDLVFGIKCYQGDQDTKGEEKRIQVNLSKCETPKERNTAQCTNESNDKPKACEFSVANSYTKTVALNSRDNPGEGTIKGRFNISGCNWPASDQPIYLKARIIIDGREILLPQTGQKIDLSLKRDWEVKFSDIYPEGRKNILGTLWDDKGNPQTYKGREISGAPVNFTIKVDQCIDKECTQTCSHNEKGDVIQVIYVRGKALPKHALTVNSNEQTKFKLTKMENGRESNVLKEATTLIKEWNLSDLSQGTYILYVQKPNDHNVSSSGWENSKDHPGFVWKRVDLKGDQTIEINFTKTGTSPTPPPASNTNTTYELTITEGEKDAYANGERFTLPTAIEKKNNVVFAPIASIVRKFGGEVDWDPMISEIRVGLNGIKLIFVAESTRGIVTTPSGNYYLETAKTYIKNGNFMVPIVEFAKALGIGYAIQEKTLNKHPQEPGNTNPEPPKQPEDISEETKPIPQGSVLINIKNNKCEFLNIMHHTNGTLYYSLGLTRNTDQNLSFNLNDFKTNNSSPQENVKLRVELKRCLSGGETKSTRWSSSRDANWFLLRWRILGPEFTLKDIYESNKKGEYYNLGLITFK